jgi:hypothetical protein
LKLAVSWFVEANGSQTGLEAKIVLSQVALELLAWVHLVETKKLYKRKQFEAFRAVGRIRALLDYAGVPVTIPAHLMQLTALCHSNSDDGLGVITKIRNNLVHAIHNSRNAIKAISGPQLFECSQLALQYVELALLSITGHNGHYARRGWQGWKGDDEILVPWR